MAERTVSVTLRARIAEYQKGLSDAQRSTTNLAKEVERTKRVSSDSLKQVGTAATVVGGAMALGLGKAVSVSKDFSKQISGVAAVSDASASQLKALSDAALAAGASTKLAGVSASDAARAESELVKAGVSVSDVLGGALMGSLSLASAGQLDFGKAAEISAQAMNMFNLSGREVGDIADTLAAAANKSAADVGQLGEALRQGGLVASQMGISFEETVGTLALFADNALVGSDAGTSLKTMLSRLTPQSNEAAQEMDRLGFSAFDAQGEFIGMENLARELTDSFGGLTTEQRSAAFATIFGADAVRAATVLYSAGEEKLREYNLAVIDEGAAARMAAKQMDNLAGDVEAFGGAVETALIKTGSQGNTVLRELVQTATDAVTGFSAMPGPLQGAATGLASVTSASLLLGGGAALALPKIQGFQKALGEMGTAGQFVGSNLGKIGGIAGGLVVGVSTLSAAFGNATTKADELIATLTEDIDFSSVDSIQEGLGRVQAEVERLDEQWDQATSFKGLNEALQEGGLVAWARQLIDTTVAGDRARESVESLNAAQVRHNENLWTAVNTLGMTATEVEGLADKYGIDLKGAIGEVQPQLAAAYEEVRAGTPATNELAGATEMLSSQVATAEERLDAFARALDSVLSMAFGVEEATDALTGKILDLREEVAGAGASLDDNTEAGLKNRAMLRDLVGGVFEVVEAQAEQGATSTELQATLDRERDRLVQLLTQLGFNREEILRYTDAIDNIQPTSFTDVDNSAPEAKGKVDTLQSALDRIPSEKRTKIVADTGSADAAIAAFRNRWAGLQLRVPLTVIESEIRRDVATAGRFADGGIRESHVAQIANAGDWRVWAEPETGGEAYIPLSRSKRMRSLAIWEETGRRLGAEGSDYAAGGFHDLKRAGYDHVHAADQGGIFAPRWMAFDNGGYLQPGWTMAYNGTGAPEAVGSGRATPVENHYHFHGPVMGNKAGARDFVRMVDDVNRGRRRMSGV